MFDELTQVAEADVYKAGVLAARLIRRRDHVEFLYLPDYGPESPAVALTLPVTAEPIRVVGRGVPAYFAGLLPEGRRLTAIRTAVKTSADDDFSMVLAIGADPVGDVQIVVSGEPAPKFGSSADGAEELSAVSFTAVFARATGVDPDRGGLAGVQDKVSGRMINVPVRYGGADHLLKLDPPEFPHVVANEAFFLEMAEACGIPTVNWHLVADADGRPGLLIERFDRQRDASGAVRALACEDGCQASGRYPADKYAIDVEELIVTLGIHCAAGAVAKRSFLRQLVFAVITGNGDLHAKNLSLVQRDREWVPSPAYDLPSTYPYGDTTLALPLAGKRGAQVSRRAVLGVGARLGLPERAVIRVVDELIEQSSPWLDRLDRLPFDDAKRRDLRRLMRNRLRLLGERSPATARAPLVPGG